MKTLKFMLAAATAIGLASATQAGVDTLATTGFEKLSVGAAVTTGVTDNDANDSYFYYAGANPEDNESVITNGTPDIARPRGASTVDATRNNILQVSTGTDPLMRTYKTTAMQGGVLKPQTATPLSGDVYVDTLVQFTVTPHTDTVTPGDADKLMIYLKESATTNEFGEVTSTSTNLVVLGRYLDNSGGTMVFSPKEYFAVTSVVPGQWYRLTVKLIKTLTAGGSFEVQQYPAFQVFLNGQLCSFDGPCVAAAVPFFMGNYLSDISNSQVVLSLLADGTTPASLQGVGFAGEGKVDDIVFSDLNPFATVYDFTFAFDTEAGVSSVTYTVGGAQYNQARTFPEVEATTLISITSIVYEDGYEADAITPVGLTPSAGAGDNTWVLTSAGASLTVTAKQKQNTPIEPGQQDPTTYDTQAAAEAAAAKVTVGVPTAVATALTPAQQETYATLFEAKVVSDGAGGYKVEVGLTAAAEATLQEQVDDDAAEVIEDLSAATVTLTTTPGLYYSFEYGTTLGTMTEGARTLATGATLTLDRPTTENATAGFYKVLVNIAPAASAQE